MSATTNEWTVLSMLEWATSYFEERSVKTPRLSIEWLLAHVLDIKRLDLYLKYDRPLAQNELDQLRPLVKRRSNHEPLQYITGETSFYNSEFLVNSSVLIPRQETEQLVQLILDEHDDESINLLDIGTGSGCISVSLKKERDEWNISAFDISSEALKVAEENAKRNKVEIHFFEQSLFEFELEDGSEKFDVIASNPPYILPSESSQLDSEVVNHEPHLALFCEDTEKMYSALEKLCKANLKKGGRAYFEIHENYAEEVLNIFLKKGWNAKSKKDLNGKQRFIIIE